MIGLGCVKWRWLTGAQIGSGGYPVKPGEEFMMACRTLLREMRQKVVDEAGSVCACAATRHLDSFTGTGATLEVHHIDPFRLVHEHRFENLIALCPNCHRRADRGEIISWVL